MKMVVGVRVIFPEIIEQMIVIIMVVEFFSNVIRMFTELLLSLCATFTSSIG